MDNYKNIQTGAHKAWFFFDEEIVCLGANIASTASEKVYTTVNQCLASSEPHLFLFLERCNPWNEEKNIIKILNGYGMMA